MKPTTRRCSLCLLKISSRISACSSARITARSFQTCSAKNAAKKAINENNQPIHKYIGTSHKRFNRIHVCGLTVTGALGVPELPLPENKLRHRPIHSQPYPYRLMLDNINNIACGYGFSVFSSKRTGTIKVWGCGLNTDSQIGFHKGQPQKKKKKTDRDNIDYDRVSYKYLMEPAPIALPLKFDKTKVIGLACGRAHTLILTNNEGIFTLGNNAFGQCGRPIVDGEMYENSKKIHCIPHEVFPSPVVEVVCGMDHSLFLTKDGEVFACGWGADGQTGLGSSQPTSEPTLVGGDLEGVKVKHLSSFADTSLAVSEDHGLFAWGSSEYGQLSCISESTQVLEPTVLPFKKQKKIKQAAIGGTSAMILNEEGEVWVWGYGILGKGPVLDNSVWPEQIPHTLFGSSDFNRGVSVEKITCGLGSFAAITNKGELYCWGKNRNGCLGIGARRDQYFPWKVIVGSEVTDVKCGVDHMLILSKSLL